MDSGLPCSALLSKTLDALSRELDAKRDDGMPRLAVWANVLQHLRAEWVDERELPRRARVSKRALPPVLTPLKRSGYVTVEERRVRLTPLGLTADAAWRRVLPKAERRWRRRFGAARVTTLRRVLERLASRFDLLHPDFPIQYGPADPRIDGGPGRDWKPVPRPPDAITQGEPLTSLLSQAVVEITMDFDGRAGPLQFAANVLRFVPDEGIGVSELPDPYWLATMARHQFVTLSRDGTTVKASAVGRRLRDAYEPTLAAIEDEWRERHGARVVDELRGTLGAMVAEVDQDGGLPHLMSLSQLWSEARWA